MRSEFRVPEPNPVDLPQIAPLECPEGVSRILLHLEARGVFLSDTESHGCEDKPTRGVPDDSIDEWVLVLPQEFNSVVIETDLVKVHLTVWVASGEGFPVGAVTRDFG